MILNQLGIFGWKEADENLVLASLLTGDPLLLIGNHGVSPSKAGAPQESRLNGELLTDFSRRA